VFLLVESGSLLLSVIFCFEEFFLAFLLEKGCLRFLIYGQGFLDLTGGLLCLLGDYDDIVLLFDIDVANPAFFALEVVFEVLAEVEAGIGVLGRVVLVGRVFELKIVGV